MLRKTYSPTSGLARKTSIRPLLVWAGIGIITSVSVVFLLAALGALLGNHTILSLDDRIQQLFYLNPESRLYLLPIISFITALGSFRLSAIAAICFSIFFLWQRRPRFLIYGYALLSSFAMMWILNTGLKAIFRRSRPELEHLLVVHGYSFPSGHAMVSMGFYGMLFVIWAIERHQRGSGIILPFLCGIIFIFLVGLSRIMLGVHFPSDVFTGFAAGLAWILCINKGIQRAV